MRGGSIKLVKSSGKCGLGDVSLTNYLCAIGVQSPENYEIGVRAGIWGISEKMHERSDVGHRFRHARPGDVLVFSVAGNFRSVHQILSEPYVDNSLLWPEYDGSRFPHRIKIGPTTYAGDVPIKALAGQISFMMNLQAWGGAIQGPHGVFNDRLTNEDVALIQRSLSAIVPIPAAKAQASAPQAVEQRKRQEALLTFYEADIETHLLNYLDGLGLRLYQCDGKSGRQFTCPAGRIDLLCIDRTSDFVVLELKKGEAPQQTLLQLLRYMSWVRQNLANGKNVRGVIVTEFTDAELRQIIGEVPGVSIQQYRVRLEFVDQ